MEVTKEIHMNNQEMRELKAAMGVPDFKINYKTGVHYGVIEDFFKGKTDELDPRDRKLIEDLLLKEKKAFKKK